MLSVKALISYKITCPSDLICDLYIHMQPLAVLISAAKLQPFKSISTYRMIFETFRPLFPSLTDIHQDQLE